jgi:uncharacterized membrane protein (DUF106 family)
MTLIGLQAGIEELLASAVIVFMISIFYRFLINQNELREIKSSLKEKQAKVKELQKTNPQEANKTLTEVISLSNKQMRMSMKPMLLTLIIVGIILPYFPQIYPGVVVKLPLYLPYFESDFGWLAWYILVSIPLGQVFRKLLGAEL